MEAANNSNNNTETCDTPVQQKRQKTLGIRYSAIKNISKTPLTELRNSECASNKKDSASPRTPLSLNQQKISKSTGHLLTNKLSLSRRVLRKKRLQFPDNSEASINIDRKIESNDSTSTDDVNSGASNSKRLCVDNSETKIIAVDERYQQKVDELTKLIEIWKEGFGRALEDLSKKMDPPKEKSDILKLLNIPPHFINYI